MRFDVEATIGDAVQALTFEAKSQCSAHLRRERVVTVLAHVADVVHEPREILVVLLVAAVLTLPPFAQDGDPGLFDRLVDVVGVREPQVARLHHVLRASSWRSWRENKRLGHALEDLKIYECL